MFQTLFGLFMIALGFWLWFGDPGTDTFGTYFGTYVHSFFAWLDNIRPWSTILSFVFAVAAFITIKKY